MGPIQREGYGMNWRVTVLLVLTATLVGFSAWVSWAFFYPLVILLAKGSPELAAALAFGWAQVALAMLALAVLLVFWLGGWRGRKSR
jgi:hypothetical protein